MKRTTQELRMIISTTPNEVIAVNGAIAAYLRHLERTGQARGCQEVVQLLASFQRRLVQQAGYFTSPTSG